MKATFIGNPNDETDQRGSLELFDVLFPLDQAVDVSGLEPWQIDRLRGNNHFKIGAKRGRPKKEADDGNG